MRKKNYENNPIAEFSYQTVQDLPVPGLKRYESDEDTAHMRDYWGDEFRDEGDFPSQDHDGTSHKGAYWTTAEDKFTLRVSQGRMMRKYIDFSVDPCEDFYQFACGNWQRHNPIPRDKAVFNTFEMLRESLDLILKDLLEEPIEVPLGNNEMEVWKTNAIAKAKNFYKSCMDHDILEARGERPLLLLLQQLGGWPVLEPNWDSERFDWLLLMAQLRLYNNDILISQWVGPDIKNSDHYIIQFDQTTLGLQSKDFFLEPEHEEFVQAYLRYIIDVACLMGAPSERAISHAEEIVAFETELAKITTSQESRRDTSDSFSKLTLREFQEKVPGIDWTRYLQLVLGRRIRPSEPVIVFDFKYFLGLAELLEGADTRTLADYFLWRFVSHRANNLDYRFEVAKQRFYRVITGQREVPPRWKGCVDHVNSHMGMATGAMFVRRHFDENSKNDTLHMTMDIMGSFENIMEKIEWIDDATKRLASEKADAMGLKIGYPSYILRSEELNLRYKEITIDPTDYFGNSLNVLQCLAYSDLHKLGMPVNKTTWSAAPAFVNAYYSRNKNQIMFPAGILQPPFYHRNFPRCLNYGGIGVVIGHEITHAFDDMGRLFDKDGNLNGWWSDEAVERFTEHAQCLIDQYSQYVDAEASMQLDGTNTQGENIADNGGIKQAFKEVALRVSHSSLMSSDRMKPRSGDWAVTINFLFETPITSLSIGSSAYQEWLEANQGEDETLPGIQATPYQLFFLNFAQVWCGTTTPQLAKTKLKTAVHSPGRFRPPRWSSSYSSSSMDIGEHAKHHFVSVEIRKRRIKKIAGEDSNPINSRAKNCPQATAEHVFIGVVRAEGLEASTSRIKRIQTPPDESPSSPPHPFGPSNPPVKR
uniref:Endothelin-converting enzyme 1 n=1 Tax=Timema shepardi TaxID=629360 RepID=A0A7R9AKL6_TIMSH|nr:unnamed protein product [Timema shepardi]